MLIYARGGLSFYVHIVIKIYLLRCPVQLGLRVQLFCLVLAALSLRLSLMQIYFAAAPKKQQQQFWNF